MRKCSYQESYNLSLEMAPSQFAICWLGQGGGGFFSSTSKDPGALWKLSCKNKQTRGTSILYTKSKHFQYERGLTHLLKTNPPSIFEKGVFMLKANYHTALVWTSHCFPSCNLVFWNIHSMASVHMLCDFHHRKLYPFLAHFFVMAQDLLIVGNVCL